MKVCVVGAGIVGLSTAYLLSEVGHDVMVVDRDRLASGASAANGGQLSYSYVQPLADPSIWAQLPRLLFSRASPLRLRPALDPQQWQWGLRFLGACTASRSRATTARLLALAAESRAIFDAIREFEHLDCDFSTTGKLVLHRTPRAFAAARKQLRLQCHLGGRAQTAVCADEACAIEPALALGGEPFEGAIHTPSECAADCEKVCHALAQRLVQRHVRIVQGHAVTGFALRGGAAVAAITPSGPMQADAFVIAAGVASAMLARPFGVRLPLYPLKGYSITVDVADADSAPRVNITDGARKMVFARLGGRLRVAGMAELVGHDTSIPSARVDALVGGLRSVFPRVRLGCELAPWAGMRPATPTGLPVVGRHARLPGNVIVNTGHGALGFTLAFGTARQVQMLLGQA